jgi:hypothetical protein
MPQVHIGTFAFTGNRRADGTHGAWQPVQPRAHDRAVAHTVLDRFGIALADRPYTMISGGERQLCCRALAQEPTIVLDEPPQPRLWQPGKVMNDRSLAKSGMACCSRRMIPITLRAADRAICCVMASVSPTGRLAVLDRDQLRRLLHDGRPDYGSDSGAVAFCRPKKSEHSNVRGSVALLA